MLINYDRDFHTLYRAEVRRSFITTLFGTNPRSHHKGATDRVRTGDQLLPVLCYCQHGQDIPNTSTSKLCNTSGLYTYILGMWNFIAVMLMVIYYFT